MPFMSGIVVSKQLFKTLCSFGMGRINYFLQMSVKLIKYNLLILRQYMLHTELTY